MASMIRYEGYVCPLPRSRCYFHWWWHWERHPGEQEAQPHRVGCTILGHGITWDRELTSQAIRMHMRRRVNRG